ncbi:hypothetical protein [Frigidibacter sp.]|uniref:hypothetical protein n=1 Tax=Frigidibacter sp. TaxID=2586418 RepID=UPI0027375DA8|nr:hypothetical protein [Frigidibacter sp.]MDP3339304.1 hypothetical protein [Frigidibacter sp.]
MAALANAIVAVPNLADAQGVWVAEAEINAVLVLFEKQGFLAADGLARVIKT